MRAFIAFFAAGALLVTGGPAGAASLTLSAPATVSKADGTLTATGSATFDAPTKSQVFSDPIGDDELLLEATPPFQDLVAGYVQLDREANLLNLTWQVADIPETGVPEIVRYMWEFSVAPPGADEGVHFQAQAKFTNVVERNGGPQTTMPAGSVTSGCFEQDVVVTNLITCPRVAEPEVTVDAATEEITIHIPTDVLVDAEGAPLVVPGAVIAEDEEFRGIVAIAQAVVSTSAMGDLADARSFAVGEHVQLEFVPAGLEMLTPAYVATDGGGAFTHDIDVANPFLVPTSYEVVARACTDAACGDEVRTPVTLTE